MLPVTGSSFSSILIAGGALLIAGSVLLLVSQRRRLVDVEMA